MWMGCTGATGAQRVGEHVWECCGTREEAIEPAVLRSASNSGCTLTEGPWHCCQGCGVRLGTVTHAAHKLGKSRLECDPEKKGIPAASDQSRGAMLSLGGPSRHDTQTQAMCQQCERRAAADSGCSPQQHRRQSCRRGRLATCIQAQPQQTRQVRLDDRTEGHRVAALNAHSLHTRPGRKGDERAHTFTPTHDNCVRVSAHTRTSLVSYMSISSQCGQPRIGGETGGTGDKLRTVTTRLFGGPLPLVLRAHATDQVFACPQHAGLLSYWRFGFPCCRAGRRQQHASSHNAPWSLPPTTLPAATQELQELTASHGWLPR